MKNLLIPLLSLLLLSGCVGGSSAVTRFYTLEPQSITTYATVDVPPDLSIGLGPIELPDLLNRPEIVSREGQNQVLLAGFDHWAGSLKQSMERQMSEQLMQQLKTTRVARHPWPRYRALDYQIKVDILRFDGTLDHKAILSGVWSILDGEGREELRTGVFNLDEPVKGDGHQPLVAALSQLTGRLTDQLAQELALEVAARQGRKAR